MALAGCRSKPPADVTRAALEQKAREVKDTAKSGLSDFGEVITTGAKYSGHDAHGRKLWELGATRARVRNAKTVNGVTTPFTVELEGATARLYREGVPESTFIAPRIRYIKTSAGPVFTLSGGVHMTVPPSRLSASAAGKLAARGTVRLDAPEVHIEVKAKHLSCAKGATMRQGTSSVKAARLEGDTVLGEARLTGGMSAEAPEGRLAAREATWNWRTKRVSATGDVSAWQGSTIVKGARLQADTDAARGQISGGVTAQTNGGSARAASARFDWNRGTLLAEGGVRLQKEGGFLTAARIETDKNMARAVASGGVTLQKAQATLRAGRIETWDKLARATASGGVTLVQNNATVTAPRVEAWIAEKRMSATGGVRLRRDGWDVRAAAVQSSHVGQADQRVIATGGVRAVGQQGTVSAARVEWSGGKVIAVGGVRFVHDGNTLAGQKLTTDDNFQTARLTGPVTGSGSGAQLTASDVIWRRGAGRPGEGGQVSAKDGVRARWKNLDVRADTLAAAGNGSHATAGGGVLITSDEGATIKAPGARYDRDAQTVTATGNVTFNDPRRGIAQQGRTLVYDLKTKTATLTDVSGKIKSGLLNKNIFQ